MSLSKSKCWHSNNCLHFLKCAFLLEMSKNLEMLKNGVLKLLTQDNNNGKAGKLINNVQR
jgi:hypothetical protein